MNIFDNPKSVPITTSRTPISDSQEKAPPIYIEVNARKNDLTSKEFGSVIILFGWKSIADLMNKTYELENFDTYLTEYYRLNNTYIDKTQMERFLNEKANESLLSFRTSIGDKMGSGTASLTFENIDQQWICQKKPNEQTQTLMDIFGLPIFLEGMYFTIDVRGRFDSSKFYRIFTGSVSSVSVTDNPVDRKITIEGKDLSNLLSTNRYNLHPAFKESAPTSKQNVATFLSSNLAKKTGVEIAKLIIPVREKAKWNNINDMYDPLAFEEIWNQRDVPTETTSNGLVKTEKVFYNFKTSYSEEEASYVWKDGVSKPKPVTALWGGTGKTYAKNFQMSKLYVSEFKTISDILNDVGLLSFFSTYVDESGNIHFHPPKYDYTISEQTSEFSKGSPKALFEGIPKITGQEYKNIGNQPNETSLQSSPLTGLSNTENYDSFTTPKGSFVKTVSVFGKANDMEHPYTYYLTNDEIISEGSSQNSSDIVTLLQITGDSDFGMYNSISNINYNYMRAYIFWKVGADRYGLRERKITTAAFTNGDSLTVFGIAAWIRLFLERRKANFTIPMRPEITIDRPIFLEEKNLIYHIKEISHSYSAGSDTAAGEFSTSISCYAGRPLEWSDILMTNIFDAVEAMTPEKLKEALKAKGIILEVIPPAKKG